MMFHRTQNLFLRPAFPEDWKAVLAGIGEQEIVRNLASAPWPYGEMDAQKFVQLPVEPMYPRFLITRADTAETVGCIGIDPHEGDVELGYWIARPFWRKGFATEAGRAALVIAASLGHGHIMASHFADNPASGRVLRKLGFTPTGRIVERHSCGRGGAAPCLEYALDLAKSGSDMPQAA